VNPDTPVSARGARVIHLMGAAGRVG